MVFWRSATGKEAEGKPAKAPIPKEGTAPSYF
jgi:hypothetical protein